jgi:choline dehydrogenase-like flavoprotein
MLISLDNIGSEDLFDVCIIGTGPAGMTCALALEGSGKRVLLLEAGDWDYDPDGQDLYQMHVTGDGYCDPSASRLRMLGGSSNHWAGYCRPLDTHDFEPTADGLRSGWPISKVDLDPYLPEASDILDISEVPADEALGDSGFRQVHFVYSPPTRFAEKYGARIMGSGTIFLAMKATLLQIRTNGSAVSELMIQDEDAVVHTVRASKYVLAMGGIENARMMLWSNTLANGALVASPVLGQYYMDHPDFYVGEAILRQDIGLNDKDSRGNRFLSPSHNLSVQSGILGSGIRFRDTNRQGTEAIIARLGCVAPDLGRRAASLLDRDLVCGMRLVGVWEQQAVASNRITLSEERDSLGIPMGALHWVKSNVDRRSIRTALLHLGTYLSRNRYGHVRLANWLETDYDTAFPPNNLCAHHMGGTRMAWTPETGVVDKDCRVFGTENLYIAGSSVFASGGYANPTLTIVQMSLRLADHLS